MTVTTKIKVGNADIEPGIVLDGSIDSPDALDIAIAVYAESVLPHENFGEAAISVKADIIGHEAEADPNGDTLEYLYETLHELAERALDALNEATPDGYAWSIEDNSLFIHPTEED